MPPFGCRLNGIRPIDMIPRSRLDQADARPSRAPRRLRLLTLVLLATGLISGTGAVRAVAGASGDVYLVRSQKEIWRAVGPALSIRFYSGTGSRSAAARGAADLLPHFAARADSAQLRYLLISADRPIWHVGSLGVYRAWNFRYERAEDGWTASNYW
jgi:hypothetical protein